MFLFLTSLGVWAIKHQLFNEIYLGFPSKLFSKCSRQHLYVRCLYWKKSIFIILLGFWAKVSTVLSKLPFRFSQPLFEEWYNFGAKILLIQLFAVFEREVFKLLAKHLGWVVKAACYMCRENFWPETIFWKDVPFGN